MLLRNIELCVVYLTACFNLCVIDQRGCHILKILCFVHSWEKTHGFIAEDRGPASVMCVADVAAGPYPLPWM